MTMGHISPCGNTFCKVCQDAEKRMDDFLKEKFSPQTEQSKGSAGFGGYAPPVQAIKDAMWIVDQGLQGNDIWPRSRNMAQKSLRELHEFLDRLGA